MTTTQKERFRSLLLAQREQVLSGLAAADPVGGDELRHSEDLATAIASGAVDERLDRDDFNLVRKIDLALERIDQGIYDTCADCGGTIPLARLEAKPSVSLCVPCQEKKDRARR